MNRGLADRMKGYEETFHRVAVRRTPVMIRVDGRAFHSFTASLDRPFDAKLMAAMVFAAMDVAKDMQGFKAGYVQSDEASFCLTDYDTLNTQGWFDYDVSKMVSISAASMSVAFGRHFGGGNAVFDSRAFNVPESDVANAFLWRARDWERNSLQMYARAFFSHKQLHRKKREDIHEMLHGIGKNWTTDLTPVERNGVFLVSTPSGIQTRADIRPTYPEIHEAIGHLFEREAA